MWNKKTKNNLIYIVCIYIYKGLPGGFWDIAFSTIYMLAAICIVMVFYIMPNIVGNL